MTKEKRKIVNRVYTLVGKISELKNIDYESDEQFDLPSLESIEQELFNWIAENAYS